MQKMFTPVTLALALGLSCTTGSHAGGCGEADLRDDKLIVRVAPGATIETFIAALGLAYPELGAEPIDVIPGRPIHLLDLSLPDAWGPVELDAFEGALEANFGAWATWAEFLYTDEAPEGGSGSTLVDRPLFTSSYQNQYARQQIQVDAAQARSTGRGSVVAILDTGVDVTHPMLADRIVAGGWDFIDGDDTPLDLGNGIDDDGDGLTDEMVGHGTFVAGLIHLVAPEARLLPVRVLDSEGRGDLWTLARGIFHAVDRGVEVINISIGSTYSSDAVEDAIEEAASFGIVVVAAGGNCNRDEPREFPAMQSSNVIGVVAVNDLDQRGGFSNFGDRLELSAPGVTATIGGEPLVDRGIISTAPGDNLVYWEGTSMAAPLVAGTVALLRPQYPTWPAGEITADFMYSLLAVSSVNIDGANPGFEGELGAGRLNTGGAVMLGPVAPTFGDLDGDGFVNTPDLLKLIIDWNLTHSVADLDGDGRVGTADLLQILIHWG